MVEILRCAWPKADQLLLAYHDTEWGVPVTDDRKLFEFITLDAFQAGLSWAIILRKREHLRQGLANFEPQRVAEFNEDEIKALLENKNIIRNRAKLAGTVTNARAFLKVQKEFGSFAHYLWRFVDFRPVVNRWARETDIPTATPLAERLSQDLQRRGFRFVGPTICYAFLQAAGLVNDHLITCFRHQELVDTYEQLLADIQPETRVSQQA